MSAPTPSRHVGDPPRLVGVKGLEGDEARRLGRYFEAEGDRCSVCHRLKRDHTESEQATCIIAAIERLFGPDVRVIGP